MTELWLVDLETAAPALQTLERASPRLADDDHERARQFADVHERNHRLAAYTALRIVLERTAGQGVRRQSFVRAADGKPGLAAGDVAFSLSHTQGYALIGVARAGAIGVDLERVRVLKMSSRRREDILAVGAGFGARAHAMPVVDPASDDALLRAWCRLESFAKAHGHGLDWVLRQLGLRHPSARLPAGEVIAAARRLARQSGVRIVDIGLPHGIYGAVAMAAAPASRTPRLRSFPVEPGAIERLVARPRDRLISSRM
jgi:phosphopantetheinyl transferase